jgi:diguanylate cyclase (GGDEF)-like protein
MPPTPRKGLWGVLVACFAALLFSPTSASAQELTVEEAKAYYIVEIAKHIIWPDESSFERFNVAVVSTERNIQLAFEALGSPQVRDKKFHFDYFSNSDFDPGIYSLIFVDERFRGLNATLFGTLPNTLFVVDGRVSREVQLVNIVESSGRVSIRLNRDNLTRLGFEPSISLLEFAGSREELTDELRESQARLSGVLAEVKGKEQRLSELNTQLNENATSLATEREALAESKRELDAALARLHALTDEISLAQGEIESYRIEIDAQQTLSDTKQRELVEKERLIEEKEQAITDLESDIVESRLILDQQLLEIDQQLSEIDRQRNMLASKNQTIVSQRESMLVISAGLMLFLALVFVLLRLNRLRTRANQELEKLNSQLYDLATIDSLSGLFNRRHFLESAQKGFSYQRRSRVDTTLLMLDIDHFKQINDNHGHAAGDKVIRAVGEILSQDLREHDIVGRLGGEEYGMMLVDCNQTQALEIGRRLCQDVATADIMHDSDPIKVTISIGVAQLSPEDSDIENALLEADRALYKAKKQGRNQVVEHSAAEDTDD